MSGWLARFVAWSLVVLTAEVMIGIGLLTPEPTHYALPAPATTPAGRVATPVPPCTDAIADAGGVCIGEPTPAATATPEPVVNQGEVNKDPAPIDWTTMPDPATIPSCNAADDAGCYYPGLALGDACDWVNAPGLVRTWFFNCQDPTMNGVAP